MQQALAVKPKKSPQQVVDELASVTDEVALGFSTGKDSLAAWCLIRKRFKRIIPIYHYIVPELEFVEKTVKMYEDIFETHIYRLPHPWLYQHLFRLNFQPPHRMAFLETVAFQEIGFDELRWMLLEDYGYDPDMWVVSGMRGTDSPMRRMVLRQRGEVNHAMRKAYPVAWCKPTEVLDIIKKHKVPLSDDYEVFGRSYDGIDYRYLSAVKLAYPNDYRRILQWFPLVDMELHRLNLDAYAESQLKPKQKVSKDGKK